MAVSALASHPCLAAISTDLRARQRRTDVVQEMGFSQMTPVQASVIPLALKNKDLLVEVCPYVPYTATLAC